MINEIYKHLNSFKLKTLHTIILYNLCNKRNCIGI